MFTPQNRLTQAEQIALLETLKTRFEQNPSRHLELTWNPIQAKLEASPDKVWALYEMEKSGGESDILAYEQSTDTYHFYDCSKESPLGRRSFCYDRAALTSRKQNPPAHNAMDWVEEIGAQLLNEEQYRYLQQFGEFDTKTSSWLSTPNEIRKLGGALFGDYRYHTVFIYHNSAESYYSARGFRVILVV